MNFANPHFFSAILDGIDHRFILIQECESVQGANGTLVGAPRFSVGALNATKDPRFVGNGDLMEVGVNSSALNIPRGYLMAHQYIYIVHDNTDEQGWQYRSKWSEGTLTAKDEPWTRSPLASSMVRRRIWMTTVVDRNYLTVSKRLLSDNIRVDSAGYKMQGELLRYEKGTLTKSWQKRRVTLANNRIEFFSGSSKKGEIPLNDCEVRMLFESQCPGKNYAFSIRNPTGNVGILLDAENKESRRSWVLAIQYQLAINSNEFNFPPMEYAPPTGEFPDNRVLLCGDLMLQGRDSEGNTVWSPRHFQLLPREIVYYENTVLMGRIFVENARISGDSKSLNFQIESSSGIVLYLSAESPDSKNLWLLGVNKQIQAIENQKLRLENIPKEELNDAHIPASDKLALYHDDKWTAPRVSGEDEQYLQMVFSAPHSNNPHSVEFTELVPAPNTTSRNEFRAEKKQESAESAEEQFETVGSDGSLTQGQRQSTSLKQQVAQVSGSNEVSNVTLANGTSITSNTQTSSKSMTQQSSSSSTTTSRTVTQGGPSSMVPPPIMTAPSSAASVTGSALSGTTNESSATSVILNPRRSLINPKFILTVLKGVTHRFLLAMESETRVVNAKSRSPRPTAAFNVTKFPPRFTVGGPRASKDPRATPIEELIEISSNRPEIQLPSGWFMMHQYVYIVQQNTDENGWQYRSDWSEGALSSKDEQWAEKYVPAVHNVRRRLWMTTVVKKGDVIGAKKLVYDSLNGPSKKDVIMQGNLYRYNQDMGQSSTSWQRRKVLLYHNKLEFFIGNERKGEAELDGCAVKMLFGPQCPNRNYAFSVRSPSGSVNVLLEAENEEARLMWVRAINYQISLLTPEVNFQPFPYSPPTGEHPANRVLFCGDLVKDDTTLQFQLKHAQLFFYQKDKLLGRLNIEQASMTSVKEESEEEFAIKFRSGYILSVRAESAESKLAWVRAIRRQVARLENERIAASNAPSEENDDDELTPAQRFDRHHDADWSAPAMDLDAEREFARAEADKLSLFGTTEIWDGVEKQVARPGSGRSGSRSGSRSSSRSRTRGEGHSSPKDAPRASPKEAARSVPSPRQQAQQSAFGNSPQSRPRELSPRQLNATAAMMGNFGMESLANRQSGVSSTTTSKVVTSSSNTSSSTFTQSSTTTSSNGMTSGAANMPALSPNNSAAMALLQQQQQQQQQQQMMRMSGSASGDSGEQGSRPVPNFSKKFQPMTAESDSD